MGTGALPISIVAIGWAAAVMFCLFGTLISCVYRRRRVRKRKVVEQRNEEDFSKDFTESATMLGFGSNRVGGRLSLQPQRRVEMFSERGRTAETLQRSLLVPIDPRNGSQDPDESEGRIEEPIQQISRTTPQTPRAEVQVWDPAMWPPPQLPVVMPSMGLQRQAVVTSINSRSTSPSRHQRTSSAITPRTEYPFLSRPVSQYTHRHAFSTTNLDSRPLTMYTDSSYPVSTLPSYPGTTRRHGQEEQGRVHPVEEWREDARSEGIVVFSGGASKDPYAHHTRTIYPVSSTEDNEDGFVPGVELY
ncbi:hypothetical protein BDZ94DRAFT_1308787 [Collybia nuda]|uniref:Uncharacterized protein n=1 Tax=Collybia nuda TaxID=64659 RepID=A0A9P6CK44_9AGAR|nr:hypothetical protein BDZ94DRAFT_1308787 [Collybia nuda]